MREKVLIVASVASMIERFNMPNIMLLKKMGYDVDVACNFKTGSTIPTEKVKKFKNKLKSLNVNCYQIDFKRNPLHIVSTVKSYIQLKKILTINEYEMIHCHTPIGGVVARIASKNMDSKVIYTAHGFHFYHGAPLINWMFFFPIEKFLSKYTDVLITINKEDYRIAKKYFKIDVIEYVAGVGIDDKVYYPLDNELKESIKMKLGYESNFIITIIGEINSNKNQVYVVNKLNSMSKIIPNLKLLIIGSGDSRKIEELISKNNIIDNVSLLGFKDNIYDYIGISDIVISSSKREGLPVNLLEAKSMGVPILASDIRGNRDIVQVGVNGYLYNKYNFEEIFKKFIDNYDRLKYNSLIESRNIYEITVNHVMKQYTKIYK